MSARTKAYSALPPAVRRRVLQQLLRSQSERCARGGSPLYAGLLASCASDVRRGGPCWSALRSVDLVTALPLRFMGGMHRLVLDGHAPDLAAHYPSVGGDGDPKAAWPAFAATAEQHAAFLETFVEQPVQTNEVGRCRALLGGFLLVAERHGLPLRLLEVGASAGLNLRWDRYRYEARGASWGDPSSPVVLSEGFRTDPPFRPVEVTIAGREGCDLFPVDVAVPEDALTLLSYTWADQAERLAALRGALAIAATVPVSLDAADACEWLVDRVEPQTGVATVVFHSYVMQLLDPKSRARIARLLEDAGRRATGSSPLAWLQYEYLGGKGTVRLRSWPGGNDAVLARASAHGQNIEWTATSVGGM